MANEILVLGGTGRTHYFTVHDETNRVWDGTTWTALASVTWTNARQTLTETPSGSGKFLGSFPTGIVTEGRYHVIGHWQAGGSAAHTDTPVWEEYLHWTGAALYDLTDLPTAVEAADALLDRSGAVETTVTPRQALRAIAAAVAGKVSGAGTETVTIKGLAVDTTRITATVDEQGNRTAVTPSLS